MKKLLSVTLVMLLLNSLQVNGQALRLPAPSPTQTIKQDFALSSVELNYSRPAMKNRKIFGDLVPYGKVWRTGANNATTLTFGDEVIIGGKKVPAGKYGLLTIPGESEWTVIISKQLDVTSPAAYKQDQDVVRVKAKVEQLPFPIESFMINFENIKPSSMDMVLLWDNIAVNVPIQSEIESKVMAQIDNVMNKDNRPYFLAATYYMESGKDLNQAVQWLDQAIKQNPNAFWIHHQKAVALSRLGKKQDAVAAAQKSMELAKQAKSDDYVALNEKLINSLK